MSLAPGTGKDTDVFSAEPLPLLERARRRHEAAALEKLTRALEAGAAWFLLFQAVALIGLVISGRI